MKTAETPTPSKLYQNTALARAAKARKRERDKKKNIITYIPRSCMHRIVRDYVNELNPALRVTDEATCLLHDETERRAYLFLRACGLVAHNANRETITGPDAQVVKGIREIVRAI